MQSHRLNRFVAALVILLTVTLSLKYSFLAEPARISINEIELDLAKIVEATGYRLTLSEGDVPRFDVQRGNCRGNIAVADRASNTIHFLRTLHLEQFENQAEFYGADRADKVPQFYVIDHYLARSLAILGLDRGVTPYVLVGWNDNCPPPAQTFAALTLKYRRSE